jgi:hypothetical protein
MDLVGMSSDPGSRIPYTMSIRGRRMGMEMQDPSDGRPTNCIEQTATKETNVVKIFDPLMGTGNMIEIGVNCKDFLLYLNRGDFDEKEVLGSFLVNLSEMIIMRQEIPMPIADWWPLEELEKAHKKVKERYESIFVRR